MTEQGLKMFSPHGGVPWKRRCYPTFEAKLAKAGFPELAGRFCRIPNISHETANFVADEVENPAPLVRYLLAHPDEATRLCYLTPKEQYSELHRINGDLERAQRSPEAL